VVIVEHTSDNNLVTFRWLRTRKMHAARGGLRGRGAALPRGLVHHPERRSRGAAGLAQRARALGLAVAAAPTVKTHDLDVPRIGYVHAWQRTQDEGWVRAALDTLRRALHYFGDKRCGHGDLRAKYDVIIYPHVGGTRAVACGGRWP
jgi:hypothetical protein